MKKILSLLLSLIMLMSIVFVCPIISQAEDKPKNRIVTFSTIKELQDNVKADSAANRSAVYTLTQDINEYNDKDDLTIAFTTDGGIPVTIIDLNGHNIYVHSVKTENLFEITGCNDVRFVNSGNEGGTLSFKSEVSDGLSSVVYINNEHATFINYNCDIISEASSSTSSSVIRIGYGNEISILGGSLVNNKNDADGKGYDITAANQCHITLAGDTLLQAEKSNIFLYPAAALTIYSCKLEADYIGTSRIFYPIGSRTLGACLASETRLYIDNTENSSYYAKNVTELTVDAHFDDCICFAEENHKSTLDAYISAGDVYVCTNCLSYIGCKTYPHITSVSVALNKPVIGDHPQFIAWYATDQSYKEISKITVKWVDTSTNKELTADDVYKSGTSYKPYLEITPRAGYRFEYDAQDSNLNYTPYEGEVIVDGFTVEKKYKSNDSDLVLCVELKEVEPLAKKKAISSIRITDLDRPIIGKCIDNDITVASTPKDAIESVRIEWFDVYGDSNPLPSDYVFLEGKHEYYPVIYITPKVEYKFEEDSEGWYAGKTTINKVDIFNEYEGFEPPYTTFTGVLRVTGMEYYPIAEGAKQIKSVAISTADTPKAGMHPLTEVSVTTVPENAFSKVGVIWYDLETHRIMGKNDTFELGKKYRLAVKIKPAEGYFFDEDMFFINTIDITAEGSTFNNYFYCSDDDFFAGIIVNMLSITVTESHTTHTMGEWVVVTPATTDAEGVEQRKCTECNGYVEERAIPKLTHEHTPGEWVVVTPATADAEGLEQRKCTECNEVVEERAIPKLTHTHTPGEWVVVTPATADAEGLEQKKCTECGEVLEERAIPKLTTGEKILLGDANNDGKVTSADARIALRIAAKLDTPTDYQKKACDADKDGVIKASDARKILRVSAKLDPSLGYIE